MDSSDWTTELDARRPVVFGLATDCVVEDENAIGSCAMSLSELVEKSIGEQEALISDA